MFRNILQVTNRYIINDILNIRGLQLQQHIQYSLLNQCFNSSNPSNVAFYSKSNHSIIKREVRKAREQIYLEDPENYYQPEKIQIPHEKIDLQFSRSSGAGGQNVNKVNTKAEIRFHLDKADWLPNYVKDNIKKDYKRYINNENEFVLTSEKHRYQHANIKEAFDKLEEIVDQASFIPKERIATEIPQYAIEKRLKDKAARKQTKQGRQKQSMSKYFDD
ncbi:hypothetical protein CYY_001401 [Polysphondylium violaceum]|uniref:Prokaryotic-type class I peptide chain release factors domain-containing protein n=1 Tax=Polysphondylium violaceum TaxID=133409 RepID=A0A8J4Q9E2_9MYCE|nr:hypothetical protein CYY_001401 [Polysphondylium violaceum]